MGIFQNDHTSDKLFVPSDECIAVEKKQIKAPHIPIHTETQQGQENIETTYETHVETDEYAYKKCNFLNKALMKVGE